jgi:3-deoxy-D-manno-octulosonic-acid transferase
MIGSSWLSDLTRIVPAFKEKQGTLIVVPHSLKPSNIDLQRSFLEKELPGRFVLVNEMGILVELYAHADRAIIGGGFEKGIHSTLEPAIAGLPVCCGPTGVKEFTEALELQELGILTVCEDSREIAEWLDQEPLHRLTGAEIAERREHYRTLLEECLRIR